MLRGRDAGERARTGVEYNTRSVQCGCSHTRSRSPAPSGPGRSQIELAEQIG